MCVKIKTGFGRDEYFNFGLELCIDLLFFSYSVAHRSPFVCEFETYWLKDARI